MGFEAGDVGAGSDQRVRGAEGLLHDLRDGEKAPAQALVGDLEDGRFGRIDDLFRRLSLLQRAGNGAVRGIDEPAQQRFVAHHADVVLDRRPARHAVGQRSQVGDPADRLQFLVAAEFFLQRNDVDGTPGGVQVHHPRENTAVRVEREVVGVQRFRRLVVAVSVQQDGAKNGPLGVNGGGQAAVDVVISGSQGP